jgi:hypothetical protein
MIGGTPTIISILSIQYSPLTTIYPTEPSKVKANNF